MKISHRTHKPLAWLHQNATIEIANLKADATAIMQSKINFFNEFRNHRAAFAADVNVVSEPFFEAAQKAERYLVDLDDKLQESGQQTDVQGTYVLNNLVAFIDRRVQPFENNFFLFHSNGTLLAYSHYDHSTSKPRVFVSSYYNQLANVDIDLYWHFYTIALFKRYAKVETKELPALSKTKAIGVKYVNDTYQKMTILNSSWFTNLVKSEGFGVRGHFRLQPKKKDGQWTREIIWISDFQKTGYTAKARINPNS